MKTRPALLTTLAWAMACAAACTGPAAEPPVRAFYAWRTTLRLSSTEQAALSGLGAKRLFLRYFDVDRPTADEPASPRGKLVAGRADVPAGVELVPVIFLRERVFRGPTEGLAELVWREVEAMSRPLGVTPRELQLDCDWTDGTREAYFAFLRALAKVAPVPLSATIRLHQVKFRERTGVPPVARGMLMFYSTGRVGPEPGQRAIFDVATARGYVARLPEYPLPLDLALAIFSWTVHVRDHHVEGLLQATDPTKIATNPALRPIGQVRWTATSDTFVDGVFVREGDELQGETIDPATALEAARLVSPYLPPAPTPRTVTLFELSDRHLARHDLDSLERLFHAIP